jgi:serine/threonine protein kinase
VVVKFLVDPATRRHLTGRQVAALGPHSDEQLGKRRLWKDFCVPQLVEREIGRKPHLASYARHFPRTFMSTASPNDVLDEPIYTVLEHGGEDAETLTSFLGRRADILHNMKKYYSMCETFLRDACEALALLHSLGWVHHDVWSDNFIVRGDCSMWLVDFAGAHCLVDAEDLDFDRGSPHSRAVEAWWPTPTISAAYDIWGLGNLALFLCYRKQFWDCYVKSRNRSKAIDDGPDGEILDMFIEKRFADFLRHYARMREGENEFEQVLREIMGKRRTRQDDEDSVEDDDESDEVPQSPSRRKIKRSQSRSQVDEFTTPKQEDKLLVKRGSKEDTSWLSPPDSPQSPDAPSLSRELSDSPKRDRTGSSSKKKSLRRSHSQTMSTPAGVDRPTAERLLRFASMCFGPDPETRPSARQLLKEIFLADDGVPVAKTLAIKTAVLRPVVASLPGFYEA